MFAADSDLKEIVSLFRTHREVFPHLRPKEIEKSIEEQKMVWCGGVAIQFKTYKRRQKKGSFTTNVGDIHLQKIVSKNLGQTKEVFKQWIDYLKEGRIVLSVRKRNKRAIRFYEKHNFKIVSDIKWKDVEGYVMVLDL